MRNKPSISKENWQLFKRFGLSIVAIYLIVMAAIYYLAHDQLFFQDTQGCCEFPGTEYAVNEVCDGVYIDQNFDPGMDIIKSVNVQVITFLRENHGTLVLELWDRVDNSLIGKTEYDMAGIQDMSFVGITLEEPAYMNYHNLSFVMYSVGSEPGTAIAPMVKASFEDENGCLFINGEKVPGRLGFYADGQQTIWSGPHYPYIVLAGLITVVFLLLVILYKLANEKPVVCFQIIAIFKKYSFLVSQLVGSAFKTKYKRSVLGIVWSFLNPLLSMTVQYVVFSTIFRFNIANYHIYLLIGITFFNFFSIGVSRTVWAIIKNASLIKKVYVPKWIYSFSEVLSAFVDFAISIIPLFILIIFSGIKYSKAMWLVIFPVACLLVFTLGFGIMLSALMVYFRDTEHIWGVVSMIWMYVTPVFYTLDILPENLRAVIKYNPIFMFIDFSRTCIMKGISPYPGDYLRCAVVSVAMFLIGTSVFKKLQDGFLLRL